jgi:hypothetical protein
MFIEAKQNHVQGKKCSESSFLQLCVYLVILPPFLSAIIHLWLGSSSNEGQNQANKMSITNMMGSSRNKECKLLTSVLDEGEWLASHSGCCFLMDVTSSAHGQQGEWVLESVCM